MVSIVRCCNFYNTRKKTEHQAAETETRYWHNRMKIKNEEFPFKKSYFTGIFCCETMTVCFETVGTSLVMAPCELIGSSLDCLIDTLTCKQFDLQKSTKSFCNEQDFEGEGVCQHFFSNAGYLTGLISSAMVGAGLGSATCLVITPLSCCPYSVAYCLSDKKEEAAAPLQQSMEDGKINDETS